MSFPKKKNLIKHNLSRKVHGIVLKDFCCLIKSTAPTTRPSSVNQFDKTFILSSVLLKVPFTYTFVNLKCSIDGQKCNRVNWLDSNNNNKKIKKSKWFCIDILIVDAEISKQIL